MFSENRQHLEVFDEMRLKQLEVLDEDET